MNGFGFLKEFLTCPRETGAIAPSSRRLSELITDQAELSRAGSILELGPGTGAFTEKILEKIPRGAVFLSLETNPHFVTAAKRRCPGARIYNDNAANAGHYLRIHGLSHCDRIICGLPWANFGEQLQNDLLSTIMELLQPGGMFLTFAYLQGLVLPAGICFRKKIQTLFRTVTLTKPVWLNAPPAFVYCAQR